jgi:hypothetical protein
VVDDLLNNQGGKLNQGARDLVTKLRDQYGKAGSEAERSTIAAHISKIASLHSGNTLVNAASKALISPFMDSAGRPLTDPRTGKPFDAHSISTAIDTLAIEAQGEVLGAATRGDHY